MSNYVQAPPISFVNTHVEYLLLAKNNLPNIVLPVVILFYTFVYCLYFTHPHTEIHMYTFVYLVTGYTNIYSHTNSLPRYVMWYKKGDNMS